MNEEAKGCLWLLLLLGGGVLVYGGAMKLFGSSVGAWVGLAYFVVVGILGDSAGAWTKPPKK